MNRAQKIALALSLFIVALATSAYTLKDTLNPVAIYTGSNTTPTINAATSGAVTLGLTGGLPASTYSSLYGPIRGFSNNSTNQWGVFSGGDAVELGANSYLDSPGTRRSIFTGNGGARIGVFNPGSGGTNTVFEVDAHTAATTADASAPAATTVLSLTANGVAAIGPTSIFTTGQHTINGRSIVKGNQANAEALSVKSNVSTSGQSFGLVVDAGTTTADQNTLWRNQAGTTTFGQIDGTGNWAAGPGTPNQSGWASTYEVLTVKGKSGTVGSGVLELANATGNTDTSRIGVIDFVDAANTGGNELVTFNAITDGGTSANRGGYLNLLTKPNGGAIVERMRWARDGTIWIGNGGSAIPAMYSTTTSGATTCDTACATEPATLDSGSGRCTSAWRSDTRAPLTGGAVAFGCADTTSVAKSCMCMGLSL